MTEVRRTGGRPVRRPAARRGPGVAASPTPQAAAAALAHEIAQPLAAISANAHALHLLLARVPGIDEQATGAVAEILADADRAAALLHAVRILFQPQPAVLTRVDASLVVTTAARRLAAAAEQAGVTVRVDSPRPIHLDAERLLLEQAVLNVAANAIEATRRAAAWHRTVDVTATSTGAWVEIAVSDSGPGFSPEAFHRAGDAFFTTKGAGNLGLGLALVHKVVRLHGGVVRLANTGGGARVSLVLPVGQAPQG